MRSRLYVRYRSTVWGYGIAVGATVVIGLLRLAADPWLKGQGSLTPFLLAVVGAAWAGGLLPGLTATGLGSIAGTALLFLYGPDGGIETSARLLLLATFALVGGLISWGSETLRRHQDCLRKLAEDLRTRVEEAEQLLEILPVAVWVAHDPECRKVTGNAFADRLLRLPPGTNMSAESPEIRSWLTTRKGRPADPSELPLRKAISRAAPVQGCEFEVTPAGGARTLFLGNAAPLFDAGGKVRGAVAACLDITERQNLDQALRDSEERLRLAIEATGLGVFDVDALSGEITWSDAAKRIFGFPPETVMTPEIFLDRVHPEDRDLVIWATARSYDPATGGGFEVVHRIVTPAGKICWVSARGRAMFEETPQGRRAVRHTGVMLDVTAKREAELELERSRRLFQRIAEATPDLLYLFDLLHLKNLYVNEAATRILGYTPAAIHDFGPDMMAALIHPDDLAGAVEGHRRFDALAEGEVYEHELRMRHSDGSYRWLMCRDLVFERGPDGRAAVIIGVAHDITDQRATRAALLASEEQSRERAAQLADADRRKDEFLALLAHELRNPLAPIRNGLQILRRTPEKVSAYQRTLEVMERQVGQMVRLIDDLLDVSRISRGKIVLRPQPLDLPELAAHVVEAVQPLFHAAGQVLKVSLPREEILVDADPARLAQMLTNLLNNASKFTNPGGWIQLSAEVEDGFAVARVRDSGVGIDRDMLPRIFEMFVQADSSLARSQGGLGIGLTLVKRLAEMQGGAVEASSEGLGKGSEFRLRLPLARRPRKHPRASGESAARPLRPLRILVVDDHPDTVDSLGQLLEMEGHEVRTAYGGSEALIVSEDFLPEVVLCDVGMPEMSGFDVARRLRERERRPLLLVALTGYGAEEDRSRSRASGFDMHLVKPVQPAELFDILASVEPPA